MPRKTLNTYKIEINGRVQGVGFRPFVFYIATQLSLKGSVSNNENGVLIFINSDEETASRFLETIKTKKPIVSEITSISIEKTDAIAFNDFTIKISEKKQQISIPLTPDFAICNSCKAEVLDPNNRRYNYPFTTCVHCGPRYAITKKYPFDRQHTSLSTFEMCDDCQSEYDNPADKRFHSQTNSCANCGVIMRLVNNNGDLISDNQQTVINQAAELINQGKIVVIKNTNGYLLCCDATNSKAIKRLRVRKQRPNKPFAVLYPSIEMIESEFNISTYEKDALTSVVAPIVIVNNSENITIAKEEIAPNINQTGVMLPSSALLFLLMNELQQPIIATSGNLHGSPIISENETAQNVLQNVADYLLHHNLEIQFPQDDSVFKFIDYKQIILRRSRGLAPSFLEFSTTEETPVLAMGAHLKSTFTFVPNKQMYTSQYFGNLDSYEVLERYKKTINDYHSLFDTIPKTILVDEHLQYQSSILGNELTNEFQAELVSIQHHKAHFASVLGEHSLFNSEEKILGVVWDGTGLGDDNQIWGGEFFTYQNSRINRLTHFEYFDWIANDKMAKEPRLSLLSLLDEDDKEHIQHKFSSTEWNVYYKMLSKNTLKTSSVGRLFDAVASLLDITDTNSYEAEAGLLLENSAQQYQEEEYINFLENENELATKVLIKNILKAKQNGFSTTKLSASFIYTIVKVIINISVIENISIIACSGGVFQNSVLIQMLSKMAKNHQKELKINRKLSANDENISFGQLMYYQHCKN
jgi:hydrogenase maturation protein HypF